MFSSVGCVHDVVAQRSCNIIALMYGFVKSVFACACPRGGFSDTEYRSMCSPEKCNVIRSCYFYRTYYPAIGKLYVVQPLTFQAESW